MEITYQRLRCILGGRGGGGEGEGEEEGEGRGRGGEGVVYAFV